MTKDIVVLGAGMAAIPLIRQLMRTTILPSSDYKLTVIAPNTHWHFPIPMVRAILPNPPTGGPAIPEEKVFHPLDKQFKDYPADKFEFVLGKAEALDPEGKVVSATLNDGSRREVAYHKLVIATGSRARDGLPWKNLGTTEETLQALRTLQNDIKSAKTIVVSGGGPTGTETAGELGYEFSRTGAKEVFFVHNGDYPLSSILLSAQKIAQNELSKLKVKLVPNSTVTNVTQDGSKKTLQITDKKGKVTSINADVYIPATGVVPNADFAPAKLLNAGGYVKQTKTLQAESYPDIFVIGDVGSLEASKAQMADTQATHLIKALPDHLTKGTAIPEYTLDTKDAVAATLGRKKATGQAGGWKLPGFMIWWLKGRTMFTDQVDLLAAGKKTTTTTFEK